MSMSRLVAEALISLPAADRRLVDAVQADVSGRSVTHDVTIWSRALDSRTLVVILKVDPREVTPDEAERSEDELPF